MSLPLPKEISSILTPDVVERFNKYLPMQETGCWEWTGGKNSKGYGMFYAQKKNYLAHRISYVLSKGEPAEGLVIDHLCMNPPCCRPSHLEAITHSQNVLRGKNPAALNRRKTKCQYGHPLEGDNVTNRDKRWDSRTCVKCEAAMKRRTDERNRLRAGGSIPTIKEFEQRWLRGAYALPESASLHIVEYITELLARNHE